MVKTKFFPRIQPLIYCFIMMLLTAAVAAAHGTKNKELISPADLASARATYQILDVRPQAEFANGHVPGAFSLPLQELSESRMQTLGIAPDSPVVLYGVSESSARKAKMLLDILGYSNIRILAGGYTHWLEDGQDIDKGSSQPTTEALKDSAASSVRGLKVIPETRDLGIIQKENGVVTTTFLLRNSSPAEIAITEITTSCGCTTAEVEGDSIPADEERTLSVHFDPNFHKEPQGKFSRTVFLQTSNNREIQAKIEVEITQ